MKQYTISIPEDKVSLFQELSKALGFNFAETSNDVPEWHKEVIDQRLIAFEKDTSKVLPWEEVKKNILDRLK